MDYQWIMEKSKLTDRCKRCKHYDTTVPIHCTLVSASCVNGQSNCFTPKDGLAGRLVEQNGSV